MSRIKTKRSPFFVEKFELDKTLVFDSHFHSKAMDLKKQPISAVSSAVAAINTPDSDTELIPSNSNYPSAFRSISYHRHVSLPPHTSAVSYKECLKNHAAGLGGHALDGCGEFYPGEVSDSSDPTSLKCAACGCHRNFHRRHAPDETISRAPTRLLPPAPPRRESQCTSPDPSPQSPPPVSHAPPGAFYGNVPTRMLLSLRGGAWAHAPPPSDEKKRVGETRKRARTMFSEEQKAKMWGFAEKIGWRMERRQDKAVGEFCNEVGIGRNVFKVWMHNNKVKRNPKLLCSVGKEGGSFDSNINEDNVNVRDNDDGDHHQHHQRLYLFNNNGSSSTS